jgi:hypothetical protein
MTDYARLYSDSIKQVRATNVSVGLLHMAEKQSKECSSYHEMALSRNIQL